jgi:hypothetical protein
VRELAKERLFILWSEDFYHTGRKSLAVQELVQDMNQRSEVANPIHFKFNMVPKIKEVFFLINRAGHSRYK